MEYLYYLANASLTLRIVEYLRGKPYMPIGFVTVIHQIDGWVVKIKMRVPLNSQEDGNFQAFLNELGMPFKSPKHINMALVSLEAGNPPIDVMRSYQVAVVSHGSPNREDIEVFRKHCIKGLGYCPNNLT